MAGQEPAGRMDITEKVAYLKGLIEGLGYDKSTNEGKAILAIVDVLDEMALTVTDIEDGMELISEQIDEMDEDITDLQDDVYDIEDEEEDDGDGLDFDGELYEVTCPVCDNIVCIDEDMLDEGEIACPNCGESLEFDLDGGLEGCGCEDCDCCGGEHHHGDE